MHAYARHADKIQAAIKSSDAARSALVASWQRSASLHRLDPAEHKPPLRLTSAELRMAHQRIEPLIRTAQASLDRLYLAVGGVGCCVLLADTNGIPVDRRGASGDDRTFETWGLWTGTVWSEDAEGTNGIGTCIVEQRTLTIHADQHFLDRNTGLSCTTAPIFDHEGNLAAALDVSSCRADLTEGFAGLISMAVADAARRIEADHFRQMFPEARILLAPAQDKHAGGLLAIDRDDLVIGATRAARMSLGLTSDQLAKPLPAGDLLGKRELGGGELREAERAVLQRALARSDGNVAAAARLLGVSRATLHRKLNRLEMSR
ncbi:helix-turn-helix domain-containing protein [Mesorhizobium sp. NPDC059025]|uniref:helix-turn-helix domain-containing protein n=1 Tax=unclassified Mesorhizobium TaxID=325217 RepID=UPI00367B0B7B